MNKRGFKLEDREVKTRRKKKITIDPDAIGMIERFRATIENIDQRFKIYHVLLNQRLKDEAEDLLRFQIVYLMSALDFFMHELYSYGIIKIFKRQKRKTTRYESFRVPLKLVEQALFDGENIQRHLKETITEINSTFTFMSPGRIKELLYTIGYSNVFDRAQTDLRKAGILDWNESLDRMFDRIYERRNKISHQTDIEHGGSDRNAITFDEVKHYRDIIVHTVESIYQSVCHE